MKRDHFLIMANGFIFLGVMQILLVAGTGVSIHRQELLSLLPFVAGGAFFFVTGLKIRQVAKRQ